MMANNISAGFLNVGKNSYIHPTATIRGISGEARSIKIGDNSYIGENVQIICDEFELGDYCKIHHHTNVHGYKPCHIGHNAWIGQFSIIDSIGGMYIGNNCGIGACSQLWSHIKYGDLMEGCRFKSEKEMRVGEDVWFVGHCIVSPIKASDKSMAMVGSVITKDMEENRIYAGAPAKDISDKVGLQFRNVSLEEKYMVMTSLLKQFAQTELIQIVMHKEEVDFEDDISYFVVSERKYKKTLSEVEIAFMRYLLPEKAKFTPFN